MEGSNCNAIHVISFPIVFHSLQIPFCLLMLYTIFLSFALISGIYSIFFLANCLLSFFRQSLVAFSSRALEINIIWTYFVWFQVKCDRRFWWHFFCCGCVIIPLWSKDHFSIQFCVDIWSSGKMSCSKCRPIANLLK